MNVKLLVGVVGCHLLGHLTLSEGKLGHLVKHRNNVEPELAAHHPPNGRTAPLAKSNAWLKEEDESFWQRFLSQSDAMMSMMAPSRAPPSVGVDFSEATPDNPVVLDNVYDDPDTVVDVTTIPGDLDVFVATPVDGSIGVPGDSCPPSGASPASPLSGGSFITVPLNGENVVIYVCSGGQIVGRCVHVYSASPVRRSHQASKM